MKRGSNQVSERYLNENVSPTEGLIQWSLVLVLDRDFFSDQIPTTIPESMNPNFFFHENGPQVLVCKMSSRVGIFVYFDLKWKLKPCRKNQQKTW